MNNNDKEKWIRDNEQILENLKQIDKNESAMLIIRHSERFEIEDFDSVVNAGLTERGKSIAVKFGKELPIDKKIRFFSSPIQRCIDTADLIKQGICENPDAVKNGFNIDDHKNHLMLVLQGPIGDWWQISQMFGYSNHMPTVGKWIFGHYSPAIFEPFNQYVMRLAYFIFSHHQQAKEPVLDIISTHDVTIMSLLIGLLGTLDKFEWVGFFGGFIMQLKEKSILIIKDKEKIEIPFPYWWPVSNIIEKDRVVP